jgi:hypothetical protein
MQRFVCIVAIAVGLLVPARALAADFNVSMGTDSGGLFRWIINGQLSPTLTLTRGMTYTFAVNASGHPFDIKTAQVTGTASQFNSGVTGQGTQVGTLTFAVPLTAPSGLFYQCEVHGTMTGVIDVVAPAGTPALGRGVWWLLALAIGLACAAIVRLGARRRAA